jgi:hypothetical protein
VHSMVEICKSKCMYDQVDQIGRIFAHCVGVYFWQFSENYKSSPHFLVTSLHGLSMYVLLNFDKIMGWAFFF